jgi:hypothetical protein
MSTTIINTNAISSTTIVHETNTTTVKNTNQGSTIVQSAVLIKTGGYDVTAAAAENINAFTMVTYDDNGLVINAGGSIFVSGMSVRSVTAGETVEIQTQGLVTNQGWNLTPNLPIYVGINGDITQDPNEGVYCINVGHAVSSTKILLQIQPTIIRS